MTRYAAYLLISGAYVGLFTAGFALRLHGDVATVYCFSGEFGALVLGLLLCWKAEMTTPGQRRRRRRQRLRKTGHQCAKNTYRNLAAAQAAVWALLNRRGRYLEPYDCRKCGFWHLRSITMAAAANRGLVTHGEDD